VAKFPILNPGPGRLYIVGGGLKRPILAQLSEEVPNITAGYSIWNEITRPKRRTVIDWQGMTPFRMDVNFYLDKFATGESVEDLCWQIENLAVPANSNLNPPPKIRLLGALPHTELDWYVENIQWGDAIYTVTGYRSRQKVTLSVVQALDLPETLNNELRRPKTTRRGYRIVTIKKGWDLKDVAQNLLNDSLQWRRILNMKGTPFRDYKIKVGTKVKVPRD
jgi:hypothetical protein